MDLYELRLFFDCNLFERLQKIIINVKNLGIGILTADCLPIIFYDPYNNIISIAHAGWRGTMQNIAIKVIETMRNSFKSKPENIEVFFGPSAKDCCYEVGENFY